MSEPLARVRSTNVARPKPAGGRSRRDTGIDKWPVPQLEVFEPGPHYGDGGGVVGDLVGDTLHHGGANKAVYALSRSQVEHWEGELGRALRDGQLGENLTIEGLDLEAGLLINQRLVFHPQDRLVQAPEEDVVLEVSVPRTPCHTFAIHMAVPGWTKTFAAHGRCGIYLRVITPGVIRAGDQIEVLPPPPHDITMMVAFASAMGDDEAAARVVAAQCLPQMYQDRLRARLAAR
ncbi:MAG: MOSC domain-containing protein [Ornithinimicrobium sp.]|uniref:MOSC domain-containing protein n=1 Tax=Ornithinimicrobium sp. TaxID=1977084 RepID=UPI0026E02B49|nr:MOSC domain-containing protein [Ornithinimicrobium sp.]MDO5740856.1 MOSC domain-containing protein [Ornithinimicrobium sp.]